MKIQFRILILLLLMGVMFLAGLITHIVSPTGQEVIPVAAVSVAVMFVVVLLTNRWINEPLSRISNSLKNDNPDVLTALSKTDNEFGDISRCILSFLDHKAALRHETEKSHEALRSLEVKTAYLEQLIDHAPEAIVILDESFHVVRINGEFTNLYGYTIDEAIGRHISELVVPIGMEDTSIEINQNIMNGREVTLEATRRRKDGSLVDVSILGTPILFDGEVVGIYGIYRDITNRKNAESALKASEEKYRQFVESADDLIFRTDDRGRFTYVNAVALQMTGLTREKLIGTSYLDHVAPSYRNAVAEFYTDQFRRRIAKTYLEFPILGADGDEIWIGQNAQLFLNDGRITHLQCAARDITVRVLMEEKLRESENKFHSILNTIKDVIWSVSPGDDRLLYLSPSAAGLLGRPIEALAEKPFHLREFVHPDDAGIVRSGETALFESGISHMEFRVTKPDGEIRWVTAFMQLMQDGDGKAVRIDGILHDTTERKNAESALAAREKYYHSLIDNSLDIVVVLNMDATISYNSPSMDRTLALTPKEMTGRSAFELIHPDDQAMARATLMAAIAEPGSTHIVEIRVRHSNETWRNLLVKGMCVAGADPYVVVNATDITDQKSAEIKINQLSRAVEQSPVSVVITDTGGLISYVNPWFCELTGYTPEEVVGKNPSVLQSGRTPAHVYEELWSTITAGGTWRGEFCNRKKNGEMYWESATISPLRESDGTLTSYIAVKEDITKRKAAEQALIAAREAAEEASVAKAEFLATMSHEIRTPMNGVVGMTDLLLDTDLTPEQRDYAETIRVSNDALLAVINDILDFSKIESGGIELEKRPFDLTAVLESTLEIFSLKAAEKGIELLCHVDASLPDRVIGDETRLRQVLMNLVGNALKFTESGEVTIAVWPGRTISSTAGESEHELLFEVRDTGIGIPADKMDRLFKPFSQVDSSTTRKYGGTGLGLAISDQLVRLMGGHISVESRPGEGSTFSFSIRFPAAGMMVLPTLSGELGRRRVLIVDDNATNRKILATQCGRMGLAIRSTGTPAEALAWIQSGEAFDLGILDMQMPDMDGFTLGREIRLIKTKNELPLILLSSIAEPGLARDEGVFSATIMKPARWAHLREKIRTLLMPPAAVTDTHGHTTRETDSRPSLEILLAEDNPINQKLATKLFEKIGYKVDVVGDGQEAVLAVRKKAYDFIFMDMQMPRLDGVSATRQIRSMAAAGTGPRIIAMTANATEQHRQACLEAGMDDFITKPIQLKTIQTKLTQWEGKKMQTTSSTPAEDRVVNVGHLQDLGLIDESLGELVAMFTEQAPTLINEIKKHANMGELSGFRANVHELKGACANMGAFAMADVCEDLERITGHQRPKEINVMIHRLGLVYEETRHRLGELAQTNRSTGKAA